MSYFHDNRAEKFYIRKYSSSSGGVSCFETCTLYVVKKCEKGKYKQKSYANEHFFAKARAANAQKLLLLLKVFGRAHTNCKSLPFASFFQFVAYKTRQTREIVRVDEKMKMKMDDKLSRATPHTGKKATRLTD